MRVTFFFIFFLLISKFNFSQSLKGEWDGHFIDNYDKQYPIKLFFSLKKDSSYKVYSYSKGHNFKGLDTTVVCEIKYKIISADSINLQETNVLKPEKTSDVICLQKMYLKMKEKKKEIILEGNWENASKDCISYGTITFTKKIN